MVGQGKLVLVVLANWLGGAVTTAEGGCVICHQRRPDRHIGAISLQRRKDRRKPGGGLPQSDPWGGALWWWPLRACGGP